MEHILIFGHKKPDTDSVTSAIALSYLKNQLGIKAKPYILSHINRETEYVLKYFGFNEPEFLNDTKLQIKDINYHRDYMVKDDESILNTYKYMINKNITGIPLVDDKKRFAGLITATMICKEVINGKKDYLKANLKKVLETISASSLIRVDNIVKGKIVYNTKCNPHNKELIIITNKLEEIVKLFKGNTINTAIIYGDILIPKEFLKFAKTNNIKLLTSTLSYEEIIRNLHLSQPIKNITTNERFVEILEDDYYDEFLTKSTKYGFNNYPVVNKEGKCSGLLRITDINHTNKKKVILVDHNDIAQSALGLEESEILEVIDHHQLGDLRTTKPINFRNMTVGSSNTIIYSMFGENNIKIPKKIAGIMLAGILSDTLILTSPTTTEFDRIAVKNLAKIAKTNYQKFGIDMFQNGTLLGDKTKVDLINEDFKVYTVNDKKFAISQLFTLNPNEILDKKKDYIKELEKIKMDKEYALVLFCLTDISKNGSYLLFTEKEKNIVSNAFNVETIEQGTFVSKIVSRKQQIVPTITNALKM